MTAQSDMAAAHAEAPSQPRPEMSWSIIGASVVAVLLAVEFAGIAVSIPRFGTVFADFDAELPRLTLCALMFAEFLGSYVGSLLWALMIVGIAGLYVLAHQLRQARWVVLSVVLMAVGVLGWITISMWLPMVALVDSLN